MTEADLNREVARATGETVTTIKEMGFIELTPEPSDCEPQVVDWDALDESRVAMFAQG